MSKILPPFPLVFASFVLILQFFTIGGAQEIDVRIKITAEKKFSAEIRGDFATNNQRNIPLNFWFLDDYAGVTGLTKRLSIVDLYDKKGDLISRKRFAAGEQLTSHNISGFGYTIDLTPFAISSAAAHVSWANADGGLLILDDLLPQSASKTAKVTIEVPSGWKILTTEIEDEPSVFTVSDVEKAVFKIGSNIRVQQVQIGDSSIKLSISGEWLFSDAEASAMAESIFNEYERLLGRLPDRQMSVSINKFPIPAGLGNWEAGTRGRSVTLFSTDMPFKSQSLQRLHEQLRHEIFHLWIPNGVNLTGNYDWFYEGFALYQSLKTGVAVNQLRFEDFLDTLSRAYDIDSKKMSKMSLIEASKNRWSGANTNVYSRGMLIAFLSDLTLLDSSKSKVSVTTLVNEIFDKHRSPNDAVDGNTAVITAMRSRRELVPIVDRYILGAEVIDWTALIQAAGIEAGSKDQLTKLKVTAKPSGRQKDLLDKLGYNQWRKLQRSNR